MSDRDWRKPVFIDPDSLGPEQAPPRQSPREFDPDRVKSVTEAEPPPPPPASPRTGWRRAFGISLLLLLGYGIGVEISRLAHWSFARHDLLGLLFLGLVGAVAVTALALLLHTRRSLKQLRAAAALRLEAKALAEDPQPASAAVGWVHRLEKHCAGAPCDQELTRAVQLLDNHYNSAETVTFLARQALQETDRQVQTAINEASVKTGALIALSPLVSLDLLIVLWSNRRLLRRISQAYAIRPSIAQEYRLLRSSMAQLATVGLSEMAMDTGSSLLGEALSQRLSLRAGQGLASAMLTARLGYQAQALCRPLPFIDPPRAPVSRIRDHLVARLKGS